MIQTERRTCRDGASLPDEAVELVEAVANVSVELVHPHTTGGADHRLACFSAHAYFQRHSSLLLTELGHDVVNHPASLRYLGFQCAHVILHQQFGLCRHGPEHLPNGG